MLVAVEKGNLAACGFAPPSDGSRDFARCSINRPSKRKRLLQYGRGAPTTEHDAALNRSASHPLTFLLVGA